ncbi:hypothetical protein CDL12_08508 [Handroanthus impetiginosus]|uniref:DOG1 domain-containing protein n=1 Tax=Handroanthus impetiginosus TaxID=429701 RepID=A0A2G9HMR8_9LAMI|nr:hypothetical protein CDL12_08508 [Handroanthus impetiginosus]
MGRRCGPSIFIRLIDALSGSKVGSYLDEDKPGPRSRGLNELSTNQINSITSLQIRTVQKEDELSTKLASLQEEMAHLPIPIIAKEIRQGEYSQDVGEALNEHATCMVSLLEEADKYNLRLDMLKELIRLLTPIQAVDFLAAAKKLYLCLRAWGRRRKQHNEGK